MTIGAALIAFIQAELVGEERTFEQDPHRYAHVA